MFPATISFDSCKSCIFCGYMNRFEDVFPTMCECLRTSFVDWTAHHVLHEGQSGAIVDLPPAQRKSKLLLGLEGKTQSDFNQLVFLNMASERYVFCFGYNHGTRLQVPKLTRFSDTLFFYHGPCNKGSLRVHQWTLLEVTRLNCLLGTWPPKKKSFKSTAWKSIRTW